MSEHRPHLTPRAGALLAGAGAVGTAATYVALVRTRAGQELDDQLASATSGRPRARHGAKAVLDPYRPVAFAAAATALGVTGLATRGVVRTACASATLLATVGQVEHLKKTLDRPALGANPSLEWTLNSYPSGHTAGVAALAAMAVVLAPHRAGPLTLAGALATGGVGAATVAARWHRPSDVVGAALTAVQWGAIGLATAEVLDPVRR